MCIVAAGTVIIGECVIRSVDTRSVGSNIRHAVRAAGAVRGARVELALQRPYEGGEKIEEQTIRGHDNIAQVILHQGAENDGADALLLGGAIDPPDSLVRLVNARHKWQSHWSKFQAFELRHETVAHGFRSHTRLVRNEENGSTTHGARPARLLTETPVFHRRVAGASAVVPSRELTEECL